MNRRQFVTSAATLAVIPPAMLIEGCGPGSTVTDINAVITAAENVIKVAAPGASWLPSFTAAVDAVKTADLSWNTGSSSAVIVDALNALVAVTNAIPISASVASLIDVLVAGAEIVIGLFPASTTPVIASQSLKRPNPHSSTVTHVTIPHRFGRSRKGDFVAAWNSTAKTHGLTQATI